MAVKAWSQDGDGAEDTAILHRINNQVSDNHMTTLGLNQQDHQTMAVIPETEALDAWLKKHGGYLHPEIRILHSSDAGVHTRASDSIPPANLLASVPHSLTLSYLNALVDDDFPGFGMQRAKFKVEAIGFFYLMAQYINRERSFWQPYLDSLPGPDSELMQPFFFEDQEDISWLQDTDVWHTITAKKEIYDKYYRDGIAVLKEAGIDVAPYTW
jgi:hypothetical protein